ncbi:fumarylacetoacetate hydrolase family protein [Bacillus solitudinis]|uniref:fumarylacetoacetate hydrolase family protein n=1 Tax=Bacillus solitudinis TaxID=2014074 RepID=UPI000C239BDB|nr:fumarylacetoacetate hydrolase family protein [Bacillus solitudinis]
MRIIRFKENKDVKLAALTDDNYLYELPFASFLDIVQLADKREETLLSVIKDVISNSVPLDCVLEDLNVLVPIEAPEVWASGVTYKKSKEARNYEATGGKLDAATFYDKVYEAKRPEIFLKSTSSRTVGPGEEVYLRSDSTWQIPEPELGLVLSRDGRILGYVAGNDMSCRDIEGENPLYLPQAKIWKHSCSIGPAIRLAETVDNPYDFDISCRIYRGGKIVFEGTANTNQLKRTYEELVSYLIQDNDVFEGTILLTGTCIVPPNEFTLAEDDLVEIEIPSVGILRNEVKTQHKLVKKG